MSDPRYANAGGVPFVPGFEAQQTPLHHHRHRHHRHRKNKHANAGGSPLSRDESIHKVDHGQPQYIQQNEVQYSNGFGVPYAAAGGFGAPPPGAYYQQAPFAGGNFGYPNQFQGNAYAQDQFSGNPVGPTVKHHRHHRRHHHHHASSALDQSQAVPEQLIGQRSSSVLGGAGGQVRSPFAQAQGENRGERAVHHRHRHHRHHHHQSGEHQGSQSAHQSRRTHAQQIITSVGGDGYGHINEDLIFIERGDQSPHRQEPPVGYEYKGKIEVQSVDKQSRSRSRGPTSFVEHQPVPQPQPLAPAPTIGPCPPGWQQVIVSSGGAVFGGGSAAHSSLGGIGGFGGATGGVGFGGFGPTGSPGTGGGLTNLDSGYPFPSQGQIIADYIVESSTGGISSSGGSSSGGVFQQGGGGTFVEQYHSESAEEHVSTRSKVIEVWQKRTKPQIREKSRSRSRSRSRSHSRERPRERSKSPKQGPSFNFEAFRQEILAAIERIVRTGETAGTKINWTGHDGGTQTVRRESVEVERKTTTSGGGEVRVIVQPIQPVFYMPRQTEGVAIPGPAPIIHPPPIHQGSSEGPKIIYIPRNVYVPVIKPVFVPRERVIVRPQVIHVARPVLVDRPVPVTQRPIIIDRERPIPVPVRGAAQGGQGGGSRVVREEYVYRDNLPVAYGGRCAEYAGGVNYGYMPTQEQHQYAASSSQEINAGYQAQEQVIDQQYQQGGGSFQESYSGATQTNSGSALQGLELPGGGPIEVLDSTVNSSWQKTDQSGLRNRYGQSALNIVQGTNCVEQQMYQEIRQRASSGGGGGVQRSVSSASFRSGAGAGIARGGASFSSIPLGQLNNFNPEGFPHQGPAPIPVRINY